MDILDIIMLILLIASIVCNLCMYFKIEKLNKKCAKEKARLNKYKADVKRQEATRLMVQQEQSKVHTDYNYDEKGYYGYDM